MSAYIELLVKGGRRAYIDAGGILGIVTAPGMDVQSVGSDDKPISLILRGGETIPIIGTSAGVILVRARQIRERLRKEGLDIICLFLEGSDDEEVQEPMGPDVLTVPGAN